MFLFLVACSGERATEPVPADTYNIAYNVLHDAETDDYEIFVMNADGSGKKISPTGKAWIGCTMRTMTSCFLFPIAIPATAAIFVLKWTLMAIT
ncbi:MAG: hypothetical protein R3C26_16565 [Calditrichia bacterium]